MFFLGRSLGIACLALSFAACHAEAFSDDAWHSLYLTTVLAEQVRDTCSETDPALGPAIDASLAQLRAAHADELAHGRAIAQRRAASDGLDAARDALATRFNQQLQREDAPARHARCSKLAAQLEGSARRSHGQLVEPAFRKWFALQQRERQIDCGRLDGVVRTLARRLLSNASAEQPRDRLRADARGAARAAGWCLEAQGVAAREGVRVPGKFGLIGETAQAISEAAMPVLSGRDPAAALAEGRERARQYLAQPGWL